MATKLKMKMPIRYKLWLSYLAVLVVFMVMFTLIFQFAARQYLLAETKQQLRENAEVISRLIWNVPLTDRGDTAPLRNGLNDRLQLRLIGALTDVHIVIMNDAGRVVFANVPREMYETVQSNRNLVLENVPWTNARGQVLGTIVLFTELESLRPLKRWILGTQIVSGLAAALVTLLFAAWFGRQLTRPLILLRNGLRRFSLKQQTPLPDIRSGDEMEQLAKDIKDLGDRLRRSDEQQRRFIQNASHELKTPLMAIQGNAEALRDGIISGDEIKPSLDVVIGECTRLKSLVEEISLLTTLENLEESYAWERLEAGVVIEQAVQSVRPLADRAGIEIVVEGSWEVALRVDAEKLRRALLNVLANGIRYAERRVVVQGRPPVRPRSEAAGDPAIGDFEILISDDGPGFAAGEEALVFERFYKGKHGGSGIGLAIAKAVIEAHGGTIRAEQHPFGGALFRIRLPVEDRGRN